MATSLSVNARVQLGWTLTDDSNSLVDSSSAGSISWSDSLSNGTGNDQADLVYAASGTIAASGTLNVDLAGSLSSAFGSTLTFAKVKAFYFRLTADTTSSSVAIGGAGSNPAALWFKDVSDKEQVKNGGVTFHWVPGTGWAVTASTGDILKIANEDSVNVATYEMVIVGTSA